MKESYTKLKVAFILAHPDDEAIPFGLPAQLKDKGHDVSLIALTKGDLGSHHFTRRKTARIRKREFKESGHILGATTHILPFSDGYLDAKTRNARMKLLQMLREEQPDIILLPHKEDYHSDHAAAHSIGLWAAFHLPDAPILTRHGLFRRKTQPVRKQIAVYQVDTQGSQSWKSSTEDTGENTDNLSEATTILEISKESIEKSILAFKAHKSQLSPRSDGQLDYIELAKRGAKRRGTQAGFAYGAALTQLSFGGYAFTTEDILKTFL